MAKEALLTNLEIQFKYMCNDISKLMIIITAEVTKIHCSYSDYNFERLEEHFVFKRFISEARIKKSVQEKYEVEQH